MAVLRFPGHASGADLGGEPLNWIVVDTETNTSHVEWNPKYVPPDPPTEIEQAEQAVEDAKRDLADAESYLEFLKDNPPVQSREA